jgi:anti-sigma-K factor RskA
MNDREDIDGLAAEYVLGSLDAAERQQIVARRQTDAWPRPLSPGSAALGR